MDYELQQHIAQPISIADLESVASMLRDADPFRAKRILGFDQYNPFDVLSKTAEYDTGFELVLDRNVLSDVISLASPPRRPLDDHKRLSAAVMAFAIATRIYFDARVSIAETVSPNGLESARNDALLLASLQNQPARYFADIALGRNVCIPANAVNGEITPVMKESIDNLDLDLSARVRPHYGLALKLAIIRLKAQRGSTDSSHFAELLKWVYDDFMFLPGAIVYASLALSPSRCSNMLKDLKSSQWGKVVAGIWNAAWDMELLHQWGRSVRDESAENRFIMLCSFDKAVQHCATDFIASGGFNVLETIRHRWVREWGQRAGNQLADQYWRYALQHSTDATRAANRHKHQQKHWESVVAGLEEELQRSIPYGNGGNPSSFRN